MKTSFTPGRRCRAIPLTKVAPASSAIETISSTSSGESLIPGISGAISTPEGIPASLNFGHRLEPLARMRRVRLGLAPDLLVEGRHREVDAHVRDLGELEVEIEVAGDER